jgi:hypothetical protein
VLGADMALMEFCYASSPAEVYDTLIAYLGEKPQVKAFANEFIKRVAASAVATSGGELPFLAHHAGRLRQDGR